MTNLEYPSPHLIALHFIKRGVMSAQLLISKEFLPPGRASLSSASETHFFPAVFLSHESSVDLKYDLSLQPFSVSRGDAARSIDPKSSDDL